MGALEEYSVARLLAETLTRQGIPRGYGIIGTSILDFMDVLYSYRDRIDFVTTRHEQVALAAADGEARVTGRPGLAVVHAGPGFLNGIIALAASFRDRVPLLIVTGGVRRRLYGTFSWLEVDQETLSKPISKLYIRVGTANSTPDALLEVFHALYSQPRTPVVLEIPEDLWQERVRVTEEYWKRLEEATNTPVQEPRENIVRDIVDRLRDAARPLLMVCGEAAFSPWFSQERLLELAEKLDAYIVVSGNGRGACPEDHPRCLGRVGFGGGNIAADKAFESSDLVLVFGNEFDDIHTYAYTMLPEGEVLVLSMDPVVEKRPPLYEHIRVDPAKAIGALVSALNKQNIKLEHSEWSKTIKQYLLEWKAMLEEALNRRYENKVNPSRFFHKLDKLLPRNRVVTGGQGTHIVYVYDYVKIYEPRSFLAATSLGAMSYAFPAALGAKLGKPEAEVVSVVGDGDFMMTVQDLETIKREGIPVKTIIVNDDSYRVLYLRQRIQKQGRIYETLLTNPDFIKLAQAFGVKALKARDDATALQVAEKLVEANEPMLVEIVIDRDDIPPMNIEYTLKMSQA